MTDFRIRDVRVAEELAAQAGADGTPAFELSPFISPVIFGPQRPPLAASGYFPGCLGVASAAVALNTSHAGIFVSGTNVDSIIRVNSIVIQNINVTDENFFIQRLDDATGFTINELVPGYINAGNPLSGGVFSAVRSNTVGVQGAEMAVVHVVSLRNEKFEGPWILNNGGLVIAPTAVNRTLRVYMNYEHWPSIRRQPIGG